jgi:hypothetical protein
VSVPGIAHTACAKVSDPRCRTVTTRLPARVSDESGTAPVLAEGDDAPTTVEADGAPLDDAEAAAADGAARPELLIVGDCEESMRTRSDARARVRSARVCVEGAHRWSTGGSNADGRRRACGSARDRRSRLGARTAVRRCRVVCTRVCALYCASVGCAMVEASRRDELCADRRAQRAGRQDPVARAAPCLVPSEHSFLTIIIDIDAWRTHTLMLRITMCSYGACVHECTRDAAQSIAALRHGTQINSDCVSLDNNAREWVEDVHAIEVVLEMKQRRRVGRRG